MADPFPKDRQAHHARRRTHPRCNEGAICSRRADLFALEAPAA